MFGSELSGTEGEVVSPLYPQRYMGSQDVSWTITVPWRKYISITFLDLDMEGDPVDDECFASLVVSGTISNFTTAPQIHIFFCIGLHFCLVIIEPL